MCNTNNIAAIVAEAREAEKQVERARKATWQSWWDFLHADANAGNTWPGIKRPPAHVLRVRAIAARAAKHCNRAAETCLRRADAAANVPDAKTAQIWADTAVQYARWAKAAYNRTLPNIMS